MADNDLEKALRDDLKEYTESPAVKKTGVTSWIYHDARNAGDQQEGDARIDEPLPNVWTKDGTELLFNFYGPKGKINGTHYLTFDHNLGKMVQERVLEGEINSDQPFAIEDFVTVALTDCVAKGSTEFVVAFSSHGGGFNGFGGDEYTGRRILTQDNESIQKALENALANVEGGPTQFDVIGFDACLMQSFEAIDDYHTLAKYFLASEATEPGHGKCLGC